MLWLQTKNEATQLKIRTEIKKEKKIAESKKSISTT